MLRSLLIAALFFLLAFAGTWLLSRQGDGVSSVSGLPVSHWQLQEPCNLQQAPCKAAGDDDLGDVSFSITPNTIPLMQELTATVTTNGITDIRSANLVVEGVNMFMGYQHAELLPIKSDAFQGNFTLPICSNTHMEWKATLTLICADKEITAAFPFETKR